MNLKHPTTNIPHHETETTPRHSPSFFPTTKHHHHHHHLPPHTAATYKECLKNHAATIGGHALDGCGEFMPDPSSYKCAACGCHRNFHRREPISTRTHFIDFHRPFYQTSTSTSPSPPISPISPQPTNYSYGEHMFLSLRTTADQNHTVATPGTPVEIKLNERKRFRTKFSQDQKEKMLSFAEKVGWKMQRCDDKLVADFCNEIGIRREVFKVWMHNNKKNTVGKKEKPNTAGVGAGGAEVGAGAGEKTRSMDSTHQEHGSSSSF